jgi:hypothetical protein
MRRRGEVEKRKREGESQSPAERAKYKKRQDASSFTEQNLIATVHSNEGGSLVKE